MSPITAKPASSRLSTRATYRTGNTGHNDTDILEGRFTFGLESLLSSLAVPHDPNPFGKG